MKIKKAKWKKTETSSGKKYSEWNNKTPSIGQVLSELLRIIEQVEKENESS